MINLKVRTHFSTTKERVEGKQHNIFIPICLGNKFFSHKGQLTENVKKYLDWALKYTKESILFIVADAVQISNYMVRNSNHSKEQNLRRILREGKQVAESLKELVAQYPPTKQIKIIQWEEYVRQDLFCSKTTRIVYEAFEQDDAFRGAVLATTRATVTDKEFSEEEYEILAHYLLDEFSACYSGVVYAGTHYDLFIYPYPDAASDFLEVIKERKIFPELHDKLPAKVGLTILR